MKLIVGLGNPGSFYADTRHNIGFEVIKALAKRNKISIKRDAGTSSLSGKGRICGEEAVLSMPQTYMNLSGQSVSRLLKKHKAELTDIIIVCDDLDLEMGRLKLRAKGSSGGHRGLKSIMEALESQDFCRLRVGVGRPYERSDASEYVLMPFKKNERQGAQDAIAQAALCCETFVCEGIEKAMNQFNRRSIDE